MPQLIRQYITEMNLHLEYLTRQPELPLDEKLHFLRETRHCYGRTALVLSGGGALGVFHLVCDLLPAAHAGLLSYVLCGRHARRKSLSAKSHGLHPCLHICECVAGRGQGTVRQ